MSVFTTSVGQCYMPVLKNKKLKIFYKKMEEGLIKQ